MRCHRPPSVSVSSDVLRLFPLLHHPSRPPYPPQTHCVCGRFPASKGRNCVTERRVHSGKMWAKMLGAAERGEHLSITQRVNDFLVATLMCLNINNIMGRSTGTWGGIWRGTLRIKLPLTRAHTNKFANEHVPNDAWWRAGGVVGWSLLATLHCRCLISVSTALFRHRISSRERKTILGTRRFDLRN